MPVPFRPLAADPMAGYVIEPFPTPPGYDPTFGQGGGYGQVPMWAVGLLAIGVLWYLMKDKRR